MEYCVSCGKQIESVLREEEVTLKNGNKVLRKRYYNNHKCSKRHDASRTNRERNYIEPFYVRLSDGFKLMGK